MAEKFDCLVIGSGPGGFAAAARCARRGASVAMVEKEFIGGTCLNWGCIPSKALLASARTLLLARNAAAMGIDVASAEPNWAKVQARKDAIVNGFRKGMTATAKGNKVEMIQGRGIVTSANKVKIETDATHLEVEADKIILATGSAPIAIPNIAFDGRVVVSSKEVLSLEQIPKSMLIIGGGVIGCEMACVYAAMGTKITIVEALCRLIPAEDEWTGRLLAREFGKLGIDVMTGQGAASVSKVDGMARVVLEDGRTIETEKVLVSVGRKGVCDEETVEALNLEMSSSVIKVNEKLETSAAGVYALGDVVGTTYLAHGASAEARVVAANATGGDARMSDYSLIPRVIYTFPEVASVGKTEQVCKLEGLDVSVGKAVFRANGRSAAENETTGEARVVRNNADDKIIGVTIVGAIATEMVALARTLIGSAEEVEEITFAHPTVMETLKEAAEDAFGLNIYNTAKITN